MENKRMDYLLNTDFYFNLYLYLYEGITHVSKYSNYCVTVEIFHFFGLK